MIFVQIFRPPSDKKNYVSKMPQKQEKMSFKNVWKKMTKKKSPPLMTPQIFFAPPPFGSWQKFVVPVPFSRRWILLAPIPPPVISRPPTPEIMSLP